MAVGAEVSAGTGESVGKIAGILLVDCGTASVGLRLSLIETLEQAARLKIKTRKIALLYQSSMCFSLDEIQPFDTDLNPFLTSLSLINYNLAMKRDNQSWLADLHAEGDQRDDALNDLRVIIMRVLPGPLSRYLSPESGHFDAFLEDVAQETILRVLDRLETFEGRSNFTTWVYKIAIHIALGELRLRKWKEFSLDKLEEGQDPDQMPSEVFAADDPNPEMTLEQKEAMSLVQKIIGEELTPRQRSVMVAVNVHGVPMDVVADRVGSNRNALYKMMHDARLKLKRRLEREGFSPEEILSMFGT